MTLPTTLTPDARVATPAARNGFRGTVVLAPAGHGQLPMIDRARSSGLRVVALDRQPDAPGLRLADIGLPIDPAVSADAADDLRRYGVDAVLCAGHDPSLIPLSALARALDLPAVSEEVLRTCRYKHLARAWFESYLPAYSTDYAVVADEHALLDAWRRIGPDVVIKPVDGCGSRGVVVIRRAADLAWAFAQAVASSACGLVIVERFLRGKEVTLDGFVVDGAFVPVAVTQRLLGPEPYRVLVGHIHPAALTGDEARELYAAAARVVGAMGVQSGPVHSEWIVTNAGPRVVEFVYRLGGGCLTAGLLPIGCGVDLVDVAIALAMDEKPVVERRWERPACLRFVTKPFPGSLTSNRQNRANASPGVVDVRVWDANGEADGAGVNSACRAGWVIAIGDNPTAALTNADNALEAMGVLHSEERHDVS